MDIKVFDSRIRRELQCCTNIKRIESSIACEGRCTAKVVLQCGKVYWIDEFDMSFIDLIVRNIHGHAK